ncbi:MAG: hypothetical protein RLZ86_1428 [Actinomycetota bacterium]
MRKLLVLSSLVLAGCGASSSESVEIRLLDDVVVMAPAEVVAMKATIPDQARPITVSSSESEGAVESGAASTTTATETTLPLNQDDRPAELKLFDAYANFKSCIEDAGETIRGNRLSGSGVRRTDPDLCSAQQDRRRTA